jgi:hypothetical protein
MNQVKVFEFFQEGEGGTPVSNLSSTSYWAEFDENDGKTADDWANDPGFQNLEKNLGISPDYLLALNSEGDDVEKFKGVIANSLPEKTVKSTQEYVTSWEYYTDLGIAVACGNGGAPDWFFVLKTPEVELVEAI